VTPLPAALADPQFSHFTRLHALEVATKNRDRVEMGGESRGRHALACASSTPSTPVFVGPATSSTSSCSRLPVVTSINVCTDCLSSSFHPPRWYPQHWARGLGTLRSLIVRACCNHRASASTDKTEKQTSTFHQSGRGVRHAISSSTTRTRTHARQPRLKTSSCLTKTHGLRGQRCSGRPATNASEILRMSQVNLVRHHCIFA
jgi:hypothetical protein